jgi:hypothetical protein
MSFIYSFITKPENRRAEQVLSKELAPVAGGKIWGEGVGR